MSQQNFEEENPESEEVNENILPTRQAGSREQSIETTEPETTNDKSQTETMEVHHHPDLHNKRKKLKKYFLEFVMIFLVVTLIKKEYGFKNG